MRLTITADIKVVTDINPDDFPIFVLELEQQLNSMGLFEVVEGTKAALRFHFHDTTVEGTKKGE